jgi:hypothetical protein
MQLGTSKLNYIDSAMRWNFFNEMNEVNIQCEVFSVFVRRIDNILS